MIQVLTCTLCLTHDCTLRCNYCYAGRKYKHAMSQETAQKAIDICLAEAKRVGKGLDLSFFGGEPLLEWELLQWCYEYREFLHGVLLRLKGGQMRLSAEQTARLPLAQSYQNRPCI